MSVKRFKILDAVPISAAAPGILEEVGEVNATPLGSEELEEEIKGDVKLFLQALIERLKGPNERVQTEVRRLRELRNRVKDYEEIGYDESKINYSDAVKALAHVIDEDAVVTCDAGWNQVAMFSLPVHRPRRFLSPVGYNSMGYALPAAIGAKSALPGTDVVATTGDAGFIMTAAEISTAVETGTNIMVVVFNDGKQGVLYTHQKLFYGNRTFATDSHEVDWVKLAESMGACGIKVENRDGLVKDLEEALKTSRNEPVVVDVPINPDAIPLPASRFALRGGA